LKKALCSDWLKARVKIVTVELENLVR